MKKGLSAIIALVLLLLFASPISALAAAPAGAANSAPQEILVKFQPGTPASEIAEIHRQAGGLLNKTIPGIGVQVVTVPAGKVAEKVKAYLAHSRVTYAEPDYTAQALSDPNDTYYAKQWGMQKVQAGQAWDTTTGSSNVNIAILDTGVDLDHPDLASKVIKSVNYTSSATVDDVYGHGTHVAGIAAAATNNGIGVAGLGYEATIMSVKVLDDSGSGYYSWVAAGIVWAADNGAEVINMSLGGTSSSLALQDAVNYAWNKGVVIAASAGNSGTTTPSYPAAYTNCIAVAATDVNDALASWSNRGSWVDVAAPGVSIYSTLINNSYGSKSGTSMASPHVAGLAALVFTTVSDSNGNGVLNDEVRARIQASCDNIGVSGIGSGRINAARAVGDVKISPGNITGVVKDAATTSVIAGALVSDGVRTATTDASGRYAISGVPPGTYQVTASKDGYESATKTVTVQSNVTATADFSLAPKATATPVAMWVDSITFTKSGTNLFIKVKVVTEKGGLAGAAVGMKLVNGAKYWLFNGVTDSAGVATFKLGKAASGKYTATITSLTCNGYVWDTAKGITEYTCDIASKVIKSR